MAQFKDQSLEWSARLRHSNIIIEERVIKRAADANVVYEYGAICCLTDCFTATKHKWSMKMNTIRGGVVIGICQVRQAQ